MAEPKKSPLIVQSVGDNPTKLWGLTMAERTRRIAEANGYSFASTSTQPADGPRLLTNATFAFDPAWLMHFAARPGSMLTLGGIPAIAHVSNAQEANEVIEAIRQARAPVGLALETIAYESGPTIENKKLRKRETPFLMALHPETVPAIERASYFGAYKGVTDVLTKYLWPEWALVLTRIAAKFGITPNMVTAVGAILCVGATFAFAQGMYWLGLFMGLGFMVLDTVDGKLARCTITSSWWGNVFDHGMDIVHPPFWWWFWATGLSHWGLAYDRKTFILVMFAILGGYIVQRLIEGAFIARFKGMELHVWEKFDSQFRLITARRNPNMVILFVSLLLGRPDVGLIVVAWWTAICCIIHAIRLVQALARQQRGHRLKSWMADA